MARRMVVAVVLGGLSSVLSWAEAPTAAHAPVAAALERFADHEREDKGIPGLAIALVDDQQVVWSAGLGWADEDRTMKLTPDPVYRVGSVSKLFTDVAVMQLVGEGRARPRRPRHPLPARLPAGEPVRRRHHVARCS